MKNLRFFTIALSLMMLVSSCSLWNKVFNQQPKEGCPSNGKNVGAEKVLSGDAKTMKDLKKARKFRS